MFCVTSASTSGDDHVGAEPDFALQMVEAERFFDVLLVVAPTGGLKHSQAALEVLPRPEVKCVAKQP